MCNSLGCVVVEQSKLQEYPTKNMQEGSGYDEQNQNLFQPCDNLNEFWCDDYGKTYIIEENKVIEEDAQ